MGSRRIGKEEKRCCTNQEQNSVLPRKIETWIERNVHAHTKQEVLKVLDEIDWDLKKFEEFVFVSRNAQRRWFDVCKYYEITQEMFEYFNIVYLRVSGAPVEMAKIWYEKAI